LGIGPATVVEFHLDDDLRRAVAKLAERIRSPEADQLAQRMKAARYALWISVRGAGPRTPLNFGEWVGATLRALEERHFEPFVAFDGLSIQPTFTLDSWVRGANSRDQIRRERELVESVMARSGFEYAYLGGLPLYDAFYLSRFASFFVCHSGSLQHKVKWMRPNLPGLVHANVQRSDGEYAWDATLDAERSRFIPTRFIRDEKPAGYGDQPVTFANYPYWIEPVEEAADWTAQHIASALERWSR
jgi:hypothetical protein